MHATVTPDAVLGPIQTEWSNSLSSLGITTPPPVTGQVFDSIITNGTVGTGQQTTKTSAASAIGKTQSLIAFSVGTKVVTLKPGSNNIVTIRIKVEPALVGKTVQIWRATKNSAGVWSAFVKLTTRTHRLRRLRVLLRVAAQRPVGLVPWRLARQRPVGEEPVPDRPGPLEVLIRS